ncbi:hypothetical protein A1O3_05715 [Capronia epimyces CBS 606.96]|uniref:Xylanolytic transcriptional activator regulatory domain-containing protein n=1 Tax=Capronia epimyces CBS 606.96 TaxID=1182542 RepID=W9Y5Y1_9EURO|nr:uncharacterized protein A1O3_05715 [Capronia epimyces CBS 606.96]EXJ85040.1 hypothetical protein A1O3_05715 [Capronia epimyces CBS 606.96]
MGLCSQAAALRNRKRRLARRSSTENSDSVTHQDDDAHRLSEVVKGDSPQSRFSNTDGHDARLMIGDPPTPLPRHKAAISLDQVSATDPDSYKERISSAGLTQEIIDNFGPETVLESSTSALPGGIGRSLTSSGATQDEITVEELFKFELPSKRVTDYLLNAYMGAIHWFMTVFHEPTLRTTYEALMASRSCPRSRSNHAIFILLILSLGAHYAPEEEVRQKFPSFNLRTFQRISLKRVEDSLHTLYDAAELESVQVCALLGSFYMYHGRPNLGFAILGAGLGCAQVLSLHKESSWRWLSEIAKEERRRTFWALFVFDRFASTIFGRPCGIPVNDIQVKIPENMGDSTVQHPRFRSTAKMPDGKVEAVTTFSYVKYKVKLYHISSPIISDLYFHRSANVSELASKISRINEELVNWFNSLPPELKLEDLFRNSNEPVTSNTRPFMLQALALQIAYDNVQILLHRPLLSQDLRKFKTTANSPLEPTGVKAWPEPGVPVNDGQPYSRDVHQILISSRDHCWDSAIRSSRLGRYQQCLISARDSHACAFLGINLFTAGMVLCVVALSRPLSSQAQMAKQAVARIMTLSRFLSGKALLSAQTTKILKALVRLIGEKEINAMLAGSSAVENIGYSSVSKYQSDGGLVKRHPPMDDIGVSTEPAQAPTAQAPPSHTHTTQTPTSMTTESGMEDAAFFSYQDPATAADDGFDFAGFETMDFNNGIVTLQQVATPDATQPVTTTTTTTTTTDAGTTAASASLRDHTWSRSRGEYNPEHAYVNQVGGGGGSGGGSGGANGVDDGGFGILGSTDFSMMNSVGQTWLWDNVSW